MAQDESRPDDLDRDEPGNPDDVRGIADDEEFEEDEDTEDLGDEEQYDADERLTHEIGSEGGSPGETVASRTKRSGQPRGSEATTTWNPEQPASEVVERVGEENQPRKRNP